LYTLPKSSKCHAAHASHACIPYACLLCPACSATSPLEAAQLLLDNGDTSRAAKLVLSVLPASGAAAPPSAPLLRDALRLLQRCILAQSDVVGARRLREALDTWADGVGEGAAGEEAASLRRRVTVYRGRAQLLEAQLLLGVGPAGGTAAADAGKREEGKAAVPESWEQAEKGGKEPAASTLAAAVGEASALLVRAAQCFAEAGDLLGQLEAAALLLRFPPAAKAPAASGPPPQRWVPEAAEPALQALAAPTADASAYPTAPGQRAAASQRSQLAAERVRDCASAVVGEAELVARVSKLPIQRLTQEQKDCLTRLEDFYGLSGLSIYLSGPPDAKPAPMLSRTPAQPPAVVSAKAARRAWLGAIVAAAAPGGASKGPAAAPSGPAAAKPGQGSYAQVASKATLQPSRQRTGKSGVPAPEFAAWASTAELLQACLRSTAEQAELALPQAALSDGSLQRHVVANIVSRDVAVKAVCAAHLALRAAVDSFLRGQVLAALRAGGKAGPQLTGERARVAMAPLLRALDTAAKAKELLRFVDREHNLLACWVGRFMQNASQRQRARVLPEPVLCPHTNHSPLWLTLWSCRFRWRARCRWRPAAARLRSLPWAWLPTRAAASQRSWRRWWWRVAGTSRPN
jgi:hypothetical protein